MDSWQHVLRWRATVHPDVLALVDDRGQQLTYREFSVAVGRRAGGWAARGITGGDVVAVVAANSAEFFVEVFALQRLGAIPALVNWRLTAPEIRDLVALLEPVAVVADAAYLPLVESAAPQLSDRVVIGPAVDGWTSCDRVEADPAPWPERSLRGDSVLALVHTSGTTGRPKAIPLQHGPLIRAVAGSPWRSATRSSARTISNSCRCFTLVASAKRCNACSPPGPSTSQHVSTHIAPWT